MVSEKVNIDSPDARRTSPGKKFLFSGLMILLTLFLSEVGFRIYYFAGEAPPSVSLVSQSEDWKRKWVERRQRSDKEIFHGYDRYHPLFGWICKPNLESFQDGRQPPVSTNSVGFRSTQDFDHEKPEGWTRVVVVGDSFTFGEEVGDDDVWPLRLEQRLEDVEVFNMGIHGFGTDQQLRVLEEEGVKTHPDVVIVGFFLENILRNGLSFRDYSKPRYILQGEDLTLTNSPVPSPGELLAQKPDRPLSYLLHHLKTRLASRLIGSNLDELAEKQGLFPLTRAILARMKERSEECGAKMMVVVIPGLHWPMPKAEELIKVWGQESGFEVVELTPPFDAAEKEYKKSMYSTLHHNPLGNFIAAQAVGDALVELGWVKKPSEEVVLATQETLEGILSDDNAKPLDFYNLAKRAKERGRVREAIRYYRKTLRLRPDAALAASDLAWILATHPDEEMRNGNQAVGWAEKACRSAEFKSVSPVGSLAAAYAEVGRFDEAIEMVKKAMDLVRENPYEAQVYDLDAMMKSFEAGSPFRSKMGR